MTTVISDAGVTDVDAGTEAGQLWLSAGDVERATGWTLKPEGFCQDEVCVPVPPGREAEFHRDDQVNVAQFWHHMGRPLAASEAGDVWVLGAGAQARAAALESLEAPDFALPDLDGRLHRLSDHRGKKVLLATWASW